MTLLLRSSAALTVILAFGVQASAAEKVTFGTNWLAQPEHGGFYQ
ncbi:MAG: ABC transporter substrate-binding protein, partial [Hoeflea sp.]|nr:ABC transporter substrate-binding protein [Hoeflea sp.]